MWRKYTSTVWLWRVLPIAILVIIRVIDHSKAYSGIMGYLSALWWSDLLLVVGWLIGWLLADMDHLFYATMCNPQELTCQRVRTEIGNRNWRNAWGLLKQTEGERTNLPIRNMLTGIVMTGVGLWLVSSGAGILATGAALGFVVRLFSEVLYEADYDKWYWLFSKKFDETEHKTLLMVWGVVLFWMWSRLAGL